MTIADQIDRAVSHLGAAKAYAVSPRYVVEAVAGISDALAVLEDVEVDHYFDYDKKFA